jgi:hypothetical protein
MSKITGYEIRKASGNSNISSYLEAGWELYQEPFYVESEKLVYQAIVWREYGIIRKVLRFLFNWLW